MAKIFFSGIDLKNNEALNFRFQNLAAHPDSTAWVGINKGLTYWNTTNSKLWSWTGSVWSSSGYEHPNHSGDVVSVADGVTTIQPNVVTNSKLAKMPANTIKGNNTAGSADPLDLSAAQIRALINVQDNAQQNVATNLGTANRNIDTLDVTSSTGASTTLPAATSALSGLLAGTDKAKIDKAILTDTPSVSAVSWVDLDGLLSGNSDNKVPSQKAVKTYVDNLVLTYGALVYREDYNAATNAPLLDATPIAGIKKGWTYVVSVAGVFFTDGVEAGDMLIAKQDNPTTLAHWSVINKNIPDVLSTALTGFVSSTGVIDASTSILEAIKRLYGNDALKAPIASPTFTGVASAPTPNVDTNTTQIATTAFVLAQAANVAPITSDGGAAVIGASTRYARQDHKHASDATKANLASPALTGTPTTPTPAVDTNTTQIATTAFVVGQAANAAPITSDGGAAVIGASLRYARQDHKHASDATKANLASPTFTGTPSAPTPATADNSTIVATTAFVKAQGYSTTTGTVKKFTQTIGDGVATSFTVTHGLGADVVAQPRLVSTNEVVDCDIVITATTVVFTFNVAPTAGMVKVTILG